MTLRAGDTVTYNERPEWGTGRIDWATATLVHATFPEARPTYSGEFGPAELKHRPITNTTPQIRRTR